MTTILIGSVALRQYIETREPKDIDGFTDNDFDGFFASEDLKGDAFWHESMRDYFGDDRRFATLDELYTIKCSHVGWELRNGTWDKHMSDIVAMKKAGAQLIPELFKLLYKVWEDLHGKKQLKLQKGKDDFFTDAVTRIYDHDSIHASVA